MKYILENEKHQMAREHLIAGNLFAAKTLLMEIRDSGDPEVLVDLASVMYLTADYEESKIAVMSALEVYKSKLKTMNGTKELACRVKIAKLLEEYGFLSQAVDLYNSRIECANDFDKDRSIQILAQRLRIATTYLDKRTVSRLYSLASSVTTSDTYGYLDIQHALMKAEIQLGGINAANNRINKLLTSDLPLTANHIEWLIFDYLQDVVEHNQLENIGQELLKKFKYSEINSYNQLVWDFYLAKIGQTPISEINTGRTQGLSLLDSIRALKIMSQLQSHSDEKQKTEILNLIKLRMLGLDINTRKLIGERFKGVDIGDVTSDAPVFSSKLTGNDRKALDVFKRSKSIKLEELCFLLFGQDLTSQSLNRLRVFISRFNSKIGHLQSEKFKLQIRGNSVYATSHTDEKEQAI